VSLALAQALPNARFRQLPGGHGFIAEHGDRFNEALLDFIAWLGAASA
jgi:pimeloyl-ACP methyl ester carboxylesterase